MNSLLIHAKTLQAPFVLSTEPDTPAILSEGFPGDDPTAHFATPYVCVPLRAQDEQHLWQEGNAIL